MAASSAGESMDQSTLPRTLLSNIDQPHSPVSSTLACDRPKEAFMGGHPFPEISCTICARSVDLTVDLCADENGKTVHEECYVKHIMSSHTDPTATMTAD